MYSIFMASLKSNETAIEDLKLALGLLIRRMRAAAPSESHDLSWTQKSVLVRLEKEGHTTTSELARAEGVKPQSMGTAIAALEGMGMVERKADPTDGRQMNINLTDKGSSMRRTTRDASLSWLAQAIAKLNKQEQATLFEAGEIIKRLVEL
jgi:DNA-binding MarR family transcriptional regulator